jgi:Raf kinase inhibitor-like YbhB/YbcL family protein
MRTWSVTVLVLCNTACHGCKSSGGQPSPAPGVVLGSLTVTSNSFPANGAIPVDCTCDGADKSPQLTISAPPPGTRTLAIIADDSDAPGGTFTHWMAYNFRGDLRALPEGADPATWGGAAGTNDFNRPGYAGPCPPKGELHHYYFRVFALDDAIGAPAGSTREVVDRSMSGHVLAQGALVAVFSH